MKALKRNQQTFYYALYTGMTDVVDASHYKTGEKTKTYATPVSMKANISPARGYADVEIFGKDLEYTKTICTDDMNCPITEESVLWIDKSPFGNNNTITPYNYVVTQIAKSLNNIMYAVRKVEVS